MRTKLGQIRDKNHAKNREKTQTFDKAFNNVFWSTCQQMLTFSRNEHGKEMQSY